MPSVPVTRVDTVSNGVQTNFSVPFSYISTTDIHVYHIANDGDGTTNELAFTNVDSNTISIGAPVPSGDTVRVARETTATANLVQWSDGQFPKASEFNLAVVQLLYLIQEHINELNANNIDHRLLLFRSTADQHPIWAITNLAETLATLATNADLAAALNRIVAIENILPTKANVEHTQAINTIIGLEEEFEAVYEAIAAAALPIDGDTGDVLCQEADGSGQWQNPDALMSRMSTVTETTKGLMSAADKTKLNELGLSPVTDNHNALSNRDEFEAHPTEALGHHGDPLDVIIDDIAANKADKTDIERKADLDDAGKVVDTQLDPFTLARLARGATVITTPGGDVHDYQGITFTAYVPGSITATLGHAPEPGVGTWFEATADNNNLHTGIKAFTETGRLWLKESTNTPGITPGTATFSVTMASGGDSLSADLVVAMSSRGTLSMRISDPLGHFTLDASDTATIALPGVLEFWAAQSDMDINTNGFTLTIGASGQPTSIVATWAPDGTWTVSSAVASVAATCNIRFLSGTVDNAGTNSAAHFDLALLWSAVDGPTTWSEWLEVGKETVIPAHNGLDGRDAAGAHPATAITYGSGTVAAKLDELSSGGGPANPLMYRQYGMSKPNEFSDFMWLPIDIQQPMPISITANNSTYTLPYIEDYVGGGQGETGTAIRFSFGGGITSHTFSFSPENSITGFLRCQTVTYMANNLAWRLNFGGNYEPVNFSDTFIDVPANTPVCFSALGVEGRNIVTIHYPIQ